MFGHKKSTRSPNIGDSVEFQVDSYTTAQNVANELTQHDCVAQVMIFKPATILVSFREFHSDLDKQPVVDLIVLRAIEFVS